MDSFFLLVFIGIVALLGRRRVKRLEGRLTELRGKLELALAEMEAIKAEAKASPAAPASAEPALAGAAEPSPPPAVVAEPPIETVAEKPTPESLLAPPLAAVEVPEPPIAAAEAEPLPPEGLAVPPAIPADGGATTPALSGRRDGRSLEERLGAHWTVWIGGIALMLGAVLLVRYSIERGFFGPGMRVALGALLSAALVAGGEFLRRRDVAGPVAPVAEASEGEPPSDATPPAAGPFASPYIPGVLTAAGTVAAFATIYSAHAVYGFIGPAAAFLALGLVALAAMAAAALHGPGLAGLGLVGALATPLLVVSQTPSPWPVIAYDLVVVAAAYALARIKHWLWLAISAAVGAALWALPFIALIDGNAGEEHLRAALTHIGLQMGLAAYALAIHAHRGRPDIHAYIDPVAHVILGGFAILTVLALGAASPEHFGAGWIVGAVAIAAILAATGVGAAPAAGAIAMSGIVTLATLCLWPVLLGDIGPRPGSLAGAWDSSGAPLWLANLIWGLPPVEPSAFAALGAAMSLAVALLAGWRLLRGADLPLRVAGLYAGTAALTPLAALALAYLRLAARQASLGFALVAIVTGCGFTLAGLLFRRALRTRESAATKLALGALAASAIAAFALALVFGLDRGMLTVALALAALGTAYVAVRLDLDALRWCVAALGLLVAARLAYEPRIVGSELSKTLIFNWLLFGYGVPAASFAMAGRLLRHVRDDIPAHVADALAVLLAALLFFFEIRHALNNGDPFAPASGLVEQGLLALTSLGFSLVLTRLDAARRNIVFRYASLAAGAIAIIFAALGLGIGYNPLMNAAPLEGGRIVNALSLGYLAPSVMAAVLALSARRLRPAWYWGGAAVLAILLGFAFLILEVRVLFHGQLIIAELGAGIAELGIDAAISLGLAALFAWRAGGELAPWMKRGSVAFAAVGTAIFVLGPLGLANPLLGETRPVGGPLLNTLLIGYALPSFVSVVLARRVRALGWLRYASLASLFAILCLFAYASLEVRRIFKGRDMDLLQSFTQNELYAYSATWLVLGILLLAYGIWRGSREARLASACFVLAAVLKVFLIDLAGLEGILRALSFIGLGAVLIGIGLVYQKFVFGGRGGPAK